LEVNDAIPEIDSSKNITDCERTIAGYCAGLIEDRSTLQMGIGTIPEAVLEKLTGHKDIGIHTEMFSDGVIDLLQKGVITNKYKIKHRGKVVTSFSMGNKETL